MKKFIMNQSFIVALLFVAQVLSAQDARESKLLARWNDSTIPPTSAYNNPYNEVWGFEQNGKEYAVIGSTLGYHIMSVDDLIAGNAKKHFIAGASQGDIVIHRDMKDHKGFLYAVCDEGAARLQIIDLRQLPDTVKQVYSSNEFVVRSHNLFIDTAQNKLWLLGASNKTKLLDITVPDAPKLLASYPDSTLALPYTHDAYIRDNIGYMNCGSDGFWVVDFTIPKLPKVLGTMTGYQGAGYNHSGWLSSDKKHYYLLDETHGSPIKSIDVQNKSDLKIISTDNARSTPNQIPHNALIRGNYLYVSYYYDGLQVFDISKPDAITRVGYYDTSTIPNNSSYQGAWGVHPLKRSGRILLSDMQNGLFVFEPIDKTLRAGDTEIVAASEVFPNPVSDLLRVRAPFVADRIQMVNQLGVVLLTNQIAQQDNFEIDVKSVPAGSYFLAVYGQNGKVSITQVTVTH
jgi:choice-of-anchor B domain-containing protein